MQFFLREIALVSSAAALIFFCSCERHHPDEMASADPAKAEPAKHEKSAEPHHAPSATPAQFFPESSPH